MPVVQKSAREFSVCIDFGRQACRFYMLVQSKRAFKFDQNYILCWYSSLAYSITTDEKFIAKNTDGIESHIFVHFLSGTKMRLTVTGPYT